MPDRRVVFVTRSRALPNAGSRTLMFKVHIAKLGEFVGPDALDHLDFQEDYGFFEAEKLPKGRGWRFIRQLSEAELPVSFVESYRPDIERIKNASAARAVDGR